MARPLLLPFGHAAATTRARFAGPCGGPRAAARPSRCGVLAARAGRPLQAGRAAQESPSGAGLGRAVAGAHEEH